MWLIGGFLCPVHRLAASNRQVSDTQSVETKISFKLLLFLIILDLKLTINMIQGGAEFMTASGNVLFLSLTESLPQGFL